MKKNIRSTVERSQRILNKAKKERTYAPSAGQGTIKRINFFEVSKYATSTLKVYIKVPTYWGF